MTLDQRMRQTAAELNRSVSGRRPSPRFHLRRARGPFVALASAAAVLVPVIVISAVVFNGSETDLPGLVGSPADQPEPTTTTTRPAATTTPTIEDGLSEADLLPPGWNRGLGTDAVLVLAENGVALAVSADQGGGFTTWAMGAQAGRTTVDVAGEIPDTVVWVETTGGNPTATVFGIVEPGSTKIELQIEGVAQLTTERVFQRPEIGRAVFIGHLDASNLPETWSDWQITTTSGDGATSVIPLDIPDALDATEGVTVSMLSPLRPLVVGAATVDSLPEAVVCRAPDDIETPPNKGGVFSQPRQHPTPEEALDAFIAETASEHHLATSGYVELRTPVDLIGYGVELDGGSGFVTVISMAETGDGWFVDQWEASGC